MNEESAPIEKTGPVDRTSSVPPIRPVASAGTGITFESVDELRYQLEKMVEGRLQIDAKAKEDIPTFLRSFAKKVFDPKKKELLNKAADAMEKGDLNESLSFLRQFAAT